MLIDVKMKETFNFVELLEEGEFNQKCKFGNLIPGHSVYCHSEDPDAPRKCHHTWFYGEDAKGMQDEDCQFYEPNSIKL
jgi:hypothetical protein